MGTRAGFLGPCALFLAGCGGDAHVTFCFTSTHCNFDLDVGTQSCADTLECPHSHPQSTSGIDATSGARQVDFEATLFEAGEGRVDIEVQVFGDEVGGSSPVGVRWIGLEIGDLRLQARRDLWRLRGLPAAGIDAIEVSIPGSDFRARKGLPDRPLAGRASCDPRQSLMAPRVLADLPAGVEAGEVLEFRAPETGEVLAAGRSAGLAVEAFPPGQDDARVTVIPAGERGAIFIDRPGRWFLRALLLAEDVCDPGAAEVIVLQEAEVSAR